ncbi:hypothetical protein P2318_12000 [Myxococcaceae bacterium GXIMD 01537]
MRTPRAALLCLAAAGLAACGGNFSNDDLEFLNALPQRQDLATKLPQSTRSGGGQGPRALATLGLGGDSELFADTRRTSDEFNQSVDALLALLENIRTLPPTERAEDRRAWGPYPDREHPGHELRFVMARNGGQFDYHLQFRKEGSGEEGWWSFLSGTFRADAGIRKGEGELHLFLADARTRGLRMTGLTLFKQLDIGYQTRALPTRVELLFTSTSALLPDTRYQYRELPGNLGELRFVLKDRDAIPGGLLEEVEIVSRWTPDQGGMGGFVILAGDLKGASSTECWDASGRVTWLKRSWELGLGDPASCPDLSAFER